MVILGSTGSIGRKTIEVIGHLAGQFEIVGLSTNRNTGELRKQCELAKPHAVAIADEAACSSIDSSGALGAVGAIYKGPEGLLKLASMPEADIVVNALVGGVGLAPTIEALKTGKRVALANKESLVMAGEIVLETASEGGGEVIPVDSEHSALFQLLDGKSKECVRRIILTASGGPFRESPAEMLESVSVEETLRHPTWDMGMKITVDSATLANKGLEVIEAHHLFGLDYDRITVLVHPQSIVHSMVEFVDDSVWAHMSKPDMKIPIQYALTFPERIPLNEYGEGVLRLESLTFEEVREDIFPTLKYAYDAGRRGGTAPVAFNAANEIAVERFLERKVPFNEIPVMIRWALEHHPYVAHPKMDEILAVDGWTREKVRELETGKV